MMYLNLPPSEEGLEHAVEELVLADDWKMISSVDLASVRALQAELSITSDPDKLMELQQMYSRELMRTVCSAALCLLRQDVVAGLEAFESEFGDR